MRLAAMAMALAVTRVLRIRVTAAMEKVLPKPKVTVLREVQVSSFYGCLHPITLAPRLEAQL